MSLHRSKAFGMFYVNVFQMQNFLLGAKTLFLALYEKKFYIFSINIMMNTRECQSEYMIEFFELCVDLN